MYVFAAGCPAVEHFSTVCGMGTLVGSTHASRRSIKADFGETRGNALRSNRERAPREPDVRQAVALFLIAPMIAVSMAPPAPPAITCEMMPPMLRSPECAAAVIAGSINVMAEHPASDQTRNNVTNHAEIKVRRCLTCANAAERPCNEVDQNLFRVISEPFDSASRLLRNDLCVELRRRRLSGGRKFG